MTTRPDIATRRIRWGLCCQFLDAPIRFRTATYRYVATPPREAGRAYLAGIARDNARALGDAITHCAALGIGAFRINSGILPLSTHPQSGYALADLDDDGSITAAFRAAGALAAERDVRLSFILTSSWCSIPSGPTSWRRHSGRCAPRAISRNSWERTS